jgi:hypothetical protein
MDQSPPQPGMVWTNGQWVKPAPKPTPASTATESDLWMQGFNQWLPKAHPEFAGLGGRGPAFTTALPRLRAEFQKVWDTTHPAPSPAPLASPSPAPSPSPTPVSSLDPALMDQLIRMFRA